MPKDLPYSERHETVKIAISIIAQECVRVKEPKGGPFSQLVGEAEIKRGSRVLHYLLLEGLFDGPKAEGIIPDDEETDLPGGKVLVDTLMVGPLMTNCYLVTDGVRGQALVIDPGSDAEAILLRAEKLGLSIELVVNTHAHFDHIGANGAILTATGAKLALHSLDIPLLEAGGLDFWGEGAAAEAPQVDLALEEGDVVGVGTLELKVLHTPGHTPGGISLLGKGAVFSGDALFRGGVGRTDLPGGHWETLLVSIREKLFTLPDETLVYPGHGPATTIGREKAFFARYEPLA